MGPSRRVRDEDGNVLVIVVLVSMLIGALASLVLRTGNQADWASARDRNSEVALGVAEAGVHEAIAKIEEQVANNAGFIPAIPCQAQDEPAWNCFAGSTPEGPYSVEVTRISQGFLIDAQGVVGGDRLGRSRRVQVSLIPPPIFTDGQQYALFSDSWIELKQNDELHGDVWAKEHIIMRKSTIVEGSVTSERGWIELGQDAEALGDVWSGGFQSSGSFAISLGTGARILGSAKASVFAPTDPETCQSEQANQSMYNVAMANQSRITGSVTTWGLISPANGTIEGPQDTQRCTPAAAPQQLPPFIFNEANYDPATYHEFSSVAALHDWLGPKNQSSGNRKGLIGTFVVSESAPSQANRIDLSGVEIAGDVTIITTAPIYTDGVTEQAGLQRAILGLISHYRPQDPPSPSPCDVNQDASDCAIHVKNGFDASCKTSVLVYSDRGPSAVKNQQQMCGSIISDGISIKNLQRVDFDADVLRVIGLGGSTYEIGRWEECRPWTSSATEPCH